MRRFVFGKFMKKCHELDNRYTFALSYPYSFSRVKAIEQRLATKKPECVKVEPFAESSVSIIIVRSVIEFLICGCKKGKKRTMFLKFAKFKFSKLTFNERLGK